MLFLGTEKYPDEQAYSKYLNVRACVHEDGGAGGAHDVWVRCLRDAHPGMPSACAGARSECMLMHSELWGTSPCDCVRACVRACCIHVKQRCKCELWI